MMVEVITKYNKKKKSVIITSPRGILIREKEYRAIQRLTGGQFGDLYINGELLLKENSITELNLSGLEVKSDELTKDLMVLKSLEVINLSDKSKLSQKV